MKRWISPDHVLCLEQASNSDSKETILKEPDWFMNMGQEAEPKDNHAS